MPISLLPVGEVVYVCDDVVSDPASRKPSILNLWEIVRVPHGSSFPYILPKLCVAALMRDGEGEVRFRADVLRADTSAVVRRSQDYPVRFTDRQRSTLVVIRLKDVAFPEPGA
jgi:Family of unknown function (DUF6941)